jgi:hypothetical protein
MSTRATELEITDTGRFTDGLTLEITRDLYEQDLLDLTLVRPDGRHGVELGSVGFNRAQVRELIDYLVRVVDTIPESG